MIENISISIAEDKPLALKALLSKLTKYEHVSVAFHANNGEDFLVKFAQQPTDVVLMDIEMPIMDGITTTQKLKEKYPNVKILMLTIFDDEDRIFGSILAGASGYLLKDESADVIVKSISDVLEGGAAMSAGIALKALNYIKTTASPKTESILSVRETEILTEIKNGLSYKQIGEKLFISEGTVRKHIENTYRKLQVTNKVNAVNVATKNRWL